MELHSFNEQAFTFWLQHYSKFCLIVVFHDTSINAICPPVVELVVSGFYGPPN